METARQTPPGARPNRNDVETQVSGPSGPVVRVGCLMRRATGVPEEWPSRLRFAPQALQNPAYRPADMLRGLGGKTAGPPPIFEFLRESSYGSFGGARSEEHTSELQSLRHLVCRLLLEKKK